MAGVDCKQLQLANSTDDSRSKLTIYWVNPVSRISAGSESPAQVAHNHWNGWLTIGGTSGHHHWNTHLGTFNELDGELIAFDGEAYQLRSDGSARPATGNQKTPYAVVTFFEPQLTLYVDSPVTRQALHHDIDAQIGSANVFCAIRIDGQFNHVRTRTVERQAPPFIPFTKAVEQQPLFDFAQAAGTLVGFRSPDFIQGIGVAGYHEHFITEQRHGGGHVIDFHLQHGSVQLGIISRLVVHFPTSEDFKHANLTPAFLDRDIHRVEQSS